MKLLTDIKIKNFDKYKMDLEVIFMIKKTKIYKSPAQPESRLKMIIRKL